MKMIGSHLPPPVVSMLKCVLVLNVVLNGIAMALVRIRLVRPIMNPGIMTPWIMNSVIRIIANAVRCRKTTKTYASIPVVRAAPIIMVGPQIREEVILEVIREAILEVILVVTLNMIHLSLPR
jgi:hypothetical protein